MEKAFDTMWIIKKKFKYKAFKYFIQIIHLYLKDRSYVVWINNEIYSQRKILARVPQGSLLELFLFILYTNDITILKNTQLSMYTNDTGILIIIYGLHFKSITKIPEKLKYFIKINENKTELFIFTTR